MQREYTLVQIKACISDAPKKSQRHFGISSAGRNNERGDEGDFNYL